jgi:hypothetical protein
MTALPDNLHHWKDELSLFPDDIALSLGAMLRTVDALIGPMRSRQDVQSGPPDGYAGLTRRGPYERLLPTEWLLAEEMPDEFLRRAAMGEHAFFQLARRVPASQRRCVALFDAGPGQIGAPRIAQLAVLIVLARRAALAGAPFAWGILQESRSMFVHEVSAQNVIRLLVARTASDVTEETLADWHHAFQPGDDFWAVGLPPQTKIEASRVDIADVLTPGEAALELTVRPKRGSTRTARLTLPADADRTRLIRDPFEHRVAAPPPVDKSLAFPKIAPGTRIVFAQSGRHVSVRLLDGSFATVPIPNSPRATLGRPRITRLGPTDVLVGITVVGRRRVVVRARGTSLHVTGLEPDGKELVVPAGEAEFTHGLRTPNPCFVFRDGNKHHVFVIDANGGLFRVGAAGAFRHPRTKELRVLGVAARDTSTLFGVFANDSRAYVLKRIESRQGDAVDETWKLDTTSALARAFVNVRPGLGAPDVAVQTSLSDWTVGQVDVPLHDHAPRTRRLVRVSGSDRVVGAVTLGSEHWMVVLKPDRKTLLVRDSGGEREIIKETEPIAAATASPTSAHIAYVTFNGELMVLQSQNDHFRRVLSWQPRGVPS